MTDHSHSDLRTLFSIRVLYSTIKQVWRRFPVSVAFLCLFAILIILDVNGVKYGLDDEAEISAFLGLTLSLACYQWSRAFSWSVSICQGIAIAIAAGNFISLSIAGLHTWSTSLETAYLASFTAIFTAIFFMPVTKKTAGEWHRIRYTIRVFREAATSFAIGLLLFIAAAIIYVTISELFGVHNECLILSITIVIGFVLPVLLFFNGIPSPDQPNDDEEDFALGIAKICKNLLLPIAVIYTLIIYVYGFKILLLWNLPKGSLCMMVAGLVCVSFIIIYGLQSYNFAKTVSDSAHRITNLALRWLPLALIFPLVLMSVAILYRLNQYGVTPARLYVLTFNIWAYGAVAYLALKKIPRLNLVASSFAVIFFFTSAIPGINYCSIGQKMMRQTKDAVETVSDSTTYRLSKQTLSPIPQGFSSLEYFQGSKWDIIPEDSTVVLDLDDSLISIPVGSLTRRNNDVMQFKAQNDIFYLVEYEFYSYKDDESIRYHLRYGGFLFRK